MPTTHIETNTKTKTSSPQQHRPRNRSPVTVAHNPATIIQRVRAAPESLRSADVLQLQRTIGNQAVGRLLTEIGRIPPTGQQAPVQRQPDPEEEEMLQGKFASGVAGTLQANEEAPPNRTGMPDNLKSGLENLSGIDISGVRVQYNSPKPAQLNALAYTRGQEIHVGSGQEKHLPHEGWHAVQQMQGRVKTTMQAGGVAINDDAGLEHEADVMGHKALANAAQLQSVLEEQELLQGKSRSAPTQSDLANVSYLRNNTALSKDQSLTREQTIQKVEMDDSGNFKGLDMATSLLVGVAHENDKSFATVISEAWMSSQAHSVVYEIKWDVAVAPGGNHLGQVKDQASDWVVDKSIDGIPIGDRKDKNAPYFNNDTDMDHAPKTGRYFRFTDAIQQRRLRGGSWSFRLKVVDKHNNVLSQSHDVEVNWGE